MINLNARVAEAIRMRARAMTILTGREAEMIRAAGYEELPFGVYVLPDAPEVKIRPGTIERMRLACQAPAGAVRNRERLTGDE